MRAPILLRKIHYWGSLSIALPLIIMIGAGVLLMVKKEFDWIQPPNQEGVERNLMPMSSMQELFDSALQVEKAGFTNWEELKRADLKPGKGIIKFVSRTNWEVQVDTHTSEVLSVVERRSDVIESIHDGSFFSEVVKYGWFLPSGILLLTLSLTGIYMFFIPILKRRKRNK